MTRAWWIVGVFLIAAGVGAGLFPNPWGFDGHSVLTCGSAFLNDGYSSEFNPQCPTRRLLMGIIAALLVTVGVGLIWMNLRKTARGRCVQQ